MEMEAVDDTSEHFRAIVTDIDGTNGLQPSLKIFVRILIDPERHACETHPVTGHHGVIVVFVTRGIRRIRRIALTS
jgi:hypothetical protein